MVVRGFKVSIFGQNPNYEHLDVEIIINSIFDQKRKPTPITFEKTGSQRSRMKGA